MYFILVLRVGFLAGAERLQVKGGGVGEEKGGRARRCCVFCWGFVCFLLAGAERLQVKGGGG